MATPVPMPALSPTMKEGKITRWLKKEGEVVSSGQPIAECETDKSNLEIEAYEDGVLLRIMVGEGQMAPVGAPIAFIGEKGEKVVDAAAATPSAAPRPAVASPTKSAGSNGRSAEPMVPSEEGHRLKASPLARRMASERGVDLRAVRGSGPSGRIVKRDVDEASTRPTSGRPAPVIAARTGSSQVPLSSMRRVIAQRMAEVKPGVPHFYLSVEVEMDAAVALRAEGKALDAKVSINDVVVKAAAVALRRFPKMNVSFAGDHLVEYGQVDVGVAVAIDDGLVTPIIRRADEKGLGAIAAEARELADRARRRALRPDEYTGGSLTVSNLGMFGVDSFIAVINAPQAAILAVGQVGERVVARAGQVVVRQMMTVTLSGDHRVIDGAVGASYLKEFKALLEHPLRLLF